MEADWRQEYLDLMQNRLSPCQQKILVEGPKSLSQAWALGAMKTDYKKRMNLN